MLKLLKLSAISAGTYFGYRKLTEFETNVTINGREVESCLFGKVDRHVVTTDKGDFVLKNELRSFDFGPMLKLNSYDYGPVKVEDGVSYHITAYGVHYPQLHLYRTIVSQNGTPCTNNHCEEKPSLISSLLNKF